MKKQPFLGVSLGARTTIALVGAAALGVLLAVGYWLWGLPALVGAVAALQLLTVLAVAKTLVAQQRAAAGKRARDREVGRRLDRLAEKVDALERTAAEELAKAGDLQAHGKRVRALERAWSSASGELATSKEVGSAVDAASIRLERAHQEALAALEGRLAEWRTKDQERALKRLDRDKRNLYHEYRQIESLAALYYGIRPRSALPPTRSWTASPDFLHFLYELIRTERPSRILECGSGLSTVVMAYACEQNGSGWIVSLEHLEEYRAKTAALLCDHGVDGYADLRLAPLTTRDVGGEGHQWYDFEPPEGETYDLLIVDGPPGATQSNARYPALPLLHADLAERAVVILDDYNRGDEQQTAERWTEQLPGFVLSRLNHEKGTAVLRRIAPAPKHSER